MGELAMAMTGVASVSGRVVVLHAGALGDCVLAVHLVRELARVAPAARFTLAARSSIAGWACGRAGLPAAVSIDCVELYRDAFRPGDGAGIAQSLGPRKTMVGPQAADVDMVISLLGGPSSDMARRLDARATVPRIHVDSRCADSGAEAERHIVRQWLGQIGVALGDRPGADVGGGLGNHLEAAVDRGSIDWLPGPSVAPAGTEAVPLTRPTGIFDCAARARLARQLGATEVARPIVIVHPGSGGLRKCAALEEVESLVSRLSAQTTTGWMIGPDEIERLGDGLAARLQGIAPVVFEEDVRTAADLVAAADAFVGFDAGMTHVAALAGITTVALFGPTNPRVWRPLGPHASVVRFDDEPEARGTWIDAVVRAIVRSPTGS